MKKLFGFIFMFDFSFSMQTLTTRDMPLESLLEIAAKETKRHWPNTIVDIRSKGIKLKVKARKFKNARELGVALCPLAKILDAFSKNLKIGRNKSNKRFTSVNSHSEFVILISKEEYFRSKNPEDYYADNEQEKSVSREPHRLPRF